VTALAGGRLVVHLTNRKNAPLPLFHTTRDTTKADASQRVLPSGTHPKGGPVTKPARAEYTEAVRLRYVGETSTRSRPPL